MSAARNIDNHAYARLLSRVLPQPIRTDEELDAMTAELLRLDEIEERGKASPAERKFAELLTLLIERYEDERYPVKPNAPPHENRPPAWSTAAFLRPISPRSSGRAASRRRF